MPPAPARTRQQAQPYQRRQLHQQLHDAGREHAPGQRLDRLVHPRRQQHGSGDQRDVEQGRSQRGHQEAVEGVQDSARKRGQRNQQDVGKGNPQHAGGEVELGPPLEQPARREDGQDGRRGEHADRGDHQQDRHQRAGDVVDEVAQGARVAARAHLGQHRHEGQRERALGEQAAHEVGNLEGQEERVGRGAGAEVAREHHVANESQHPRHDRRDTDPGGRLQQLHGNVAARN